MNHPFCLLAINVHRSSSCCQTTQSMHQLRIARFRSIFCNSDIVVSSRYLCEGKHRYRSSIRMTKIKCTSQKPPRIIVQSETMSDIVMQVYYVQCMHCRFYLIITCFCQSIGLYDACGYAITVCHMVKTYGLSTV